MLRDADSGRGEQELFSEIYQIRVARTDDQAAIKALDGSFTTESVFAVQVIENGFRLLETRVHPPIVKVFPDNGEDDCDDVESRTLVATSVVDGSLAGFVSVSYVPWARRLTIDDIEVAPEHRRRGIGRALMSRVEKYASECGAGHLWLEVTNINVPAIRAYRRMGFSFCGLDTSLYASTSSTGEYALYMSKPCP